MTLPHPPDRPPDSSLIGAVYQTLASRRQSYDTLMWQVPALSLSGQAFLFTIALGSGSSTAARIIASLLAFIIAVISMQLMSKHRFHEELNSRLLERFENTYGLSQWLGFPFHNPRDVNAAIGVRGGVFVHRSSYRIWMAGLGLFAIASLIVIGLALAPLLGLPRLL
jgi:hypothetical protein